MHSAVLIGRFQPPHLAHLGLIREALARHERVLVLTGSANLARSVRNPFGPQERARMIRWALGSEARRVRFRPIPDRFDAPLWAADVRAIVESAGLSDPVLIGSLKDSSSSYLRWFPDWPLEALPGVGGLHATDLRAALWRQDWAFIGPRVHPTTLDFLHTFAREPAFERLVAEDSAIETERARSGPGHIWHERFGLYVRDDQVALIRRKGPVGFGLWSLPPITSASSSPLGTFAHPARSLLGPSEARVYAVNPPPGQAQLVPPQTALARPRRFFEDHAVILARLLNQV